MTAIKAMTDPPGSAPVRDVPRREVAGAWFLLLGYTTLLVGMVWDGQWHGDVGPDNFWTAPHLLLYTGTGIIGLTCLTVVLLSTWARGPATSTPSVTVFRTFRAPWPFLVGGLGASGNLLYAGSDLWWHELYGFDIAAGTTPSHFGLGLSIQVEIIAMVMAFAVLRRTRSERWGLALAIGVATIGSTSAFGMVSELIFDWLPGVAPRVLGLGAVGALTLSLIVGLTRGWHWPAAAGLTFLGVQGALALFAPAATRWYADAIGQPMRDYAAGMPQVLIGFPVTFPLIALAAGGVVAWAVRRGVGPLRITAAVGVIAGINTAIFYNVLGVEMNLLVTLLAVSAVGAGMGWLGWQCAAMLRRFGMTGATRTVTA
ncbi:hypothetical protein HNP84_000305 [Thermocatellispora tengchongensis]|uniref:Uncharacterized protein n=1 Tax=Thermocatellispora tengchongensis TaxID=1073253 RepID=A0A840P032_9ACTN|nr:hypothetical protein [Thermocatellispora tengchongensis]MBB5130617.1 hypothetical protein [Thermocatellispora tengchongensis]